MKRILIVTLALGFLLSFWPGADIPRSAAAKADWQADWEMTLKKAREEGELALWGGSGVRAMRESTEFFKEKFGINLLFTTGRGPDLIPKILEERRNGLYLQDVMMSGHSGAVTALKPAGAFDPLEPVLVLPEVVDQKLWYEGTYNWSDKDRFIFSFALYPGHMVVINTNLVKPGEIKSYYDLLKPKWKGKITVSDPTISGMGHTGFVAMKVYNLVDQDFFPKLLAQDPAVTRNLNNQAEALAKGKYPVALWPSLARVARYTRKGAPVKFVHDVKEGTYGGSTGCALALFNKAPHPNAAKVFINWFLSREGQTIMQDRTRKQTRREDVPSNELKISERRVPGVKYVQPLTETEDFLLNQREEYMRLAKQLFGDRAPKSKKKK